MDIINYFKITVKFIFKILLLKTTIKIVLLKITIKVIFYKIIIEIIVKIIFLLQYLTLYFKTLINFLMLLIQRKNIFFKFIFSKIYISKVFISKIIFSESLLKLLFKSIIFKLIFQILFQLFNKYFRRQIQTLSNLLSFLKGKLFLRSHLFKFIHTSLFYLREILVNSEFKVV